MNGRITLGLVILLILLGGYVYFFESSIESPSPLETDQIELYGTTYGEFDVVALEITASQGQARFIRTDDMLTRDWQMVAPQLMTPPEIDQVRVNGSAFRLATLTAGQAITNVTQLERYGLAPPTLTVTLTISSGQQITLLTGNSAPVNNNAYLQLSDQPQTVYLVRDVVVSELHQLLAVPPVAPTPLPTITPSPIP